MTSLLIPYLIAEENAFLLKGYAVFDKLILVDYLDMNTSSGVNFLKNIIRAYPIYLDDGIGLSVTYSKSKLRSNIENNQIEVEIHLDFETMVKEINSSENIFDFKTLEELTEKQNDYILDIVRKATNYSIETGRDILQLSRLIQNQHSKGWEKYEEDWNSRVSEVQYSF